MEIIRMMWELARRFMPFSMLFRSAFCILNIGLLTYVMLSFPDEPAIYLLTLYSIIGMVWMFELGEGLAMFHAHIERMARKMGIEDEEDCDETYADR